MHGGKSTPDAVGINNTVDLNVPYEDRRGYSYRILDPDSGNERNSDELMQSCIDEWEALLLKWPETAPFA